MMDDVHDNCNPCVDCIILYYFLSHTQIRKDGVRLYIIWYQILQNNNDTENHQIFSKLVSLFGDDESYFMFSEVLSMPSAESKIITIHSVTDSRADQGHNIICYRGNKALCSQIPFSGNVVKLH